MLCMFFEGIKLIDVQHTTTVAAVGMGSSVYCVMGDLVLVLSVWYFGDVLKQLQKKTGLFGVSLHGGNQWQGFGLSRLSPGIGFRKNPKRQVQMPRCKLNVLSLRAIWKNNTSRIYERKTNCIDMIDWLLTQSQSQKSSLWLQIKPPSWREKNSRRSVPGCNIYTLKSNKYKKKWD